MITDNITLLADSPTFFSAFEDEVKSGNHKTREAAYAALEAKRIEHFGRRKFKSYHSFRNSRIKYNKRAKDIFFSHTVTQAVAP